MAGTALASVINKNSPLQLNVKAVTGPTTWLPMMITKEMDLGLFTSADAYPAYRGIEACKELSAGKGFPIRLVFNAMVLTVGTIVSDACPAKNIRRLGESYSRQLHYLYPPEC